MSSSRTFVVAPGLLAILVTAAVAPSAAAGGGKGDSPEAKLRARIADLHAEVALLEIECCAARQNLLESLKKLGQIELGDRKKAISTIKNELSKAKMAERISKAAGDPYKLFEEGQGAAAGKTTNEGGDEGDKALERTAEIELKARLDSTRAEAERMKADFLKKCRLLHQKKLELADAEAEYKATR